MIIDAYSNVNPQVAAQWSANITSWGMTLHPTLEFPNLVLTELKKINRQWANIHERALLHWNST